MRSAITAASFLVLCLGCKAEPEAPRLTKVEGLELDPDEAPATTEDGPRLGAAGVSLRIPEDWTIVDSPDPNFAMAWGLTSEPTETPMCTIEVRRQGPGDLPSGAELSPTTHFGDIDYRRGGLKGRLRQLPGFTPDASLIVHCRAPRAARQWIGIEAMFDSLSAPSAPPEPPPLVDERSTIVELCAGTPVRRTHVCARRRDGAVFCGLSSGAELRRVEGLTPAVQLSCEHDLTCTRDAEGAVSCWRVGKEPAPVERLDHARDLAGGCAVDASGAVLCRTREVDGSLSDTYAELPLGLADVERVLEGSAEDHGCVLIRAGEGVELRCWDRSGALPLPLARDGAPQRVDAPSDARDLARIGGRLCVAGAEQWTCIEGESRWQLDGCERRACGCSLIGATLLSCEHEPHQRIDSRVFGRLSGVVAVSGACAATLDGRVICRGPVGAGPKASTQVVEAVAGGLPGVAHQLDLVDAP